MWIGPAEPTSGWAEQTETQGKVTGRMKRVLFVFSAALFHKLLAPAADAMQGDCITCHGKETNTRTARHLYVDPSKYALPTHARIGCVPCHSHVSKGHPKDGIRPARADCQECHAAVHAEYEKSRHGKYAGCKECHQPHAVKPLLAVSGRDINIQCAKCHEYAQMVKSHSKWLPQAALHIDALPRTTCHTGSKAYMISMYRVKRVSGSPMAGVALAGYEDLIPFLTKGETIGALIDRDGDGTISLSELKKFNRSGKYCNLSLPETLMPKVITHNYDILDNRRGDPVDPLFAARSLVKLYVPNAEDIKRGLFTPALFYFFNYFLGKKNPHTAAPDNKFNAIHKMSYLLIMFLFLPPVIITGLLLMNIGPLRGWIIMIGGIKFLVDAHYLIACSFICLSVRSCLYGDAGAYALFPSPADVDRMGRGGNPLDMKGIGGSAAGASYYFWGGNHE